MSVKINFFNSIIRDEIKKYNFKCNIEYFYISSGVKNTLKYEDEGTVVCIESSNGEWTSEQFGLGLNLSLSLENAKSLYNDNIAYKDSELGLAVLWNSAQSKRKGVIEIKKILNTNEKQFFKINKNFKPKTFFGAINLEFVLVLLKPSLRDNIFGINNTQGVQLGEFGKKSIRLDGSGSLFPVINISEKNKVLWHIAIEYEDPEIDLFCDTIRIELNTMHKDYKYIDIKCKDFYCERLVNEIFSHAIIELFVTLYDDGRLKDIKSKNFNQATVMQCAKYITETKGFDISSISSINESILDYYDKKGV